MADNATSLYPGLPPISELIQELSTTNSKGGNESKTHTRWSTLRGIGSRYSFPILYIVFVVFCTCVLKFGWGPRGVHDFIQSNGRLITNLIFLACIAQCLLQMVSMAWSNRHVSMRSAGLLQVQYDQEQRLAQRLANILPKVLAECRKRVEMEIDLLKQTSLLAMVATAIGALGQLHFGSPSYIEGALIGIMLVVVLNLRVMRQYSRLAFVLNCAENPSSPCD